MAKECDPRAQRKFKATYTGAQYRDAVRASYRLGYMDGQQKRQEMFVFLQTTNRRLWEELVRLDKEEPLDGIELTRDEAKKFIRRLRNPAHKEHQYWVRMLKRKLAAATGEGSDDVFEAVGVEEGVITGPQKKETPLTKRIDEHYHKAAKAMKRSDP